MSCKIMFEIVSQTLYKVNSCFICKIIVVKLKEKKVQFCPLKCGRVKITTQINYKLDIHSNVLVTIRPGNMRKTY